MARKIVVINGHPDPAGARFAAALADAYVGGASGAGHMIRRIDVGALDFPMIHSREDFESGEPPAVIAGAQTAISWADHVVIIFPLWLGGAPAQLKGFLEQVFRDGFALARDDRGPAGRLKGRSARLIVTMGMPAPIFRWIFDSAGLRALERGILWISGIRPSRHLILGSVEADPARREAWLRAVGRLGAAAA